MEKEEEDVISTLPTDLLVIIVERLDLQSVVRTTVLSTRWRHVAHQLSRLNLNIASCFRSGHKQAMAAAYAGVARSLLSCSSCNVTAIAVKTLCLPVTFYLLDDPNLQSIGLLVDDVVGRGATERLEMYILPDSPVAVEPSEAQKIIIGQQFMSLSRAHTTTFRWLTVLTLQWVALEASDVPYLIYACERLKELRLKSSRLVDLYSEVELDAPRSQLEKLVLGNFSCAWIYLTSLPNLKILVCVHLLDDLEYIPQVSFGYLPRLYTVSLIACAMHWHTPFALSDWLPHDQPLSTLILNFLSQMIWIRLEHAKQLDAIFRNLKVVHLQNVFVDYDLNWTLFFLEAAPSLEEFLINRHSCPNKLFLTEGIAERTNIVWEPSKNWTKHLKLKLLLIHGFEEVDMVINYARLVMKRAVGLKKILLSDTKCAICDNAINQQIIESSSSPSRYPVDEASKLRVIERLTSGNCSSVQITIC